MNKGTFYTEFAYILGLICLAWGTAFMEAADFGVSFETIIPIVLNDRKNKLYQA